MSESTNIRIRCFSLSAPDREGRSNGGAGGIRAVLCCVHAMHPKMLTTKSAADCHTV